MATILVVDDRIENREVLAYLLGHRGHKVVEANDGREGLAAADLYRPELIVSDILMPSMDGYEFVRSLRTNGAVAGTPVVFSTAHHLDREAQALARACGVEHILYKPLEPEMVLALVDRLLGSAPIVAQPPPPPDSRDAAFTERHLRLLSSQLVEKNRALEVANERLSGLLEFGLELGAERDPARVLERVSQAARALVGGRFALAVAIGARQLEAVAGLQLAGETRLFTRLPDSGPLADLLTTGKSLNLTSLSGVNLPAAFNGATTLLAAPIGSKDGIRGIICVVDKIGLSSFAAEDLALLRVMGAKAGLVLDNLQLISEMAVRTADLETEIVERGRAEEALRQSEKVAQRAEARYRAVVDTAADAMVVICQRGTIQSFNKAAERIFGYTLEEVRGLNVSMLMPEPHVSNHDRYLARYRETGERKIIGIGREVEGRRKDGTTFPLDLAVAEWFDGDLPFYTGIMRDITQRREALLAMQAVRDEAIAAKAEAERANLTKSKFMAAASHDLRQPAQSLVLFNDMLAERLKGEPEFKLVNNMTKALEGLTTMLNGMLDVSRLDAGAVVPQPASVALGEILEGLTVEYGLQAQKKSLRLRGVRTNALVVSDRALLERMVRNLIENALRYTDCGGVLVGCRRVGSQVRLDVIDSGIGIPEDKLDFIFDEFFQVGNPERDKSRGLGLGLSIVKRLSGLLGHRFEVVSEIRQGSRFSLYLPLVEGIHRHGYPSRFGAKAKPGCRLQW